MNFSEAIWFFSSFWKKKSQFWWKIKELYEFWKYFFNKNKNLPVNLFEIILTSNVGHRQYIELNVYV